MCQTIDVPPVSISMVGLIKKKSLLILDLSVILVGKSLKTWSMLRPTEFYQDRVKSTTVHPWRWANSTSLAELNTKHFNRFVCSRLIENMKIIIWCKCFSKCLCDHPFLWICSYAREKDDCMHIYTNAKKKKTVYQKEWQSVAWNLIINNHLIPIFVIILQLPFFAHKSHFREKMKFHCKDIFDVKSWSSY